MNNLIFRAHPTLGGFLKRISETGEPPIRSFNHYLVCLLIGTLYPTSRLPIRNGIFAKQEWAPLKLLLVPETLRFDRRYYTMCIFLTSPIPVRPCRR